MVLGTIIVSLTLCFCTNKPLSKIDFSKGDYKLYFFNVPIDSRLYSPTRKITEFQKKYGNFFITDKDVLRIIKEKVIQDKVLENKSSNSFYMLRLICNGKVVDGGILDLDNSEIIYLDGKYKFDIKEIEKFHNKFNKLNSFEVICPTISTSKKLIKLVENKNGFIYFGTQDGKSPFEGYSGKIELTTAIEESDVFKDPEVNKKEYEADFEEIGKAKFFESHYEGGDSIKISMLWEKDFTSKLSRKYKVFKTYSDSIYFPLNIYDINQKELVKFFHNEKIRDYKIREL